METVNRSFDPEGSALGIGEDERLVEVEPPNDFNGWVTVATLISIRHDPIASAVYRQKIGAVLVDEKRRDKGARETIAFPINEYPEGGGS
jgi:hypothetical protein